jgi:hypothetical protein
VTRVGRWGGLAVLVAALVGLGGGALHGEHAETRLTAAHFSRSATQSNAYFACLSTQAHSLLRPHDVVYLSNPTLDSWVTLTKVIGGWASETLHMRQANVGLSLVSETNGPTCGGQALVTVRRTDDGKVVFARGRGGQP